MSSPAPNRSPGARTKGPAHFDPGAICVLSTRRDARKGWCLCALAVALTACRGTSGDTRSEYDAALPAPRSCAFVEGANAERVFHPKLLMDNPGTAFPTLVGLQAIEAPVPVCHGVSTFGGGCDERDRALLARARTNQEQIECVLQGLASGRERGNVTALWYEVPYRLTNGSLVPIATAFHLDLTWAEVERMAGNNFVSVIEPAPGTARSIGIAPPDTPKECQTPGEFPESKVRNAAAIRDRGRQPVVIEVKDPGVLLGSAECAEAGRCDPTSVLWERTVHNTRHVMCILRRIDAVVAAEPTKVAYQSRTGNPTGAPLPPLGQLPTATKAFGIGLTWEEVLRVAENPYVESIWTSSDLQVAPEPPSGCPPVLSAPVPPKICATTTELSEGKISSVDRARWESTGGAHRVLVTVRGGAKVCPLPNCPAACDERDRFIARWKEENREAQRCVRDLLMAVGGTAAPEPFWLVNAFDAVLTWEQIQRVAVHPDVERIEAAEGGMRSGRQP